MLGEIKTNTRSSNLKLLTETWNETCTLTTHKMLIHIELSICLTCRSCIWCWSPAGTSPLPPWTPGTDGRVLYPTAASPGSRERRRLVRRRRQRPRRSSSSSRARGWEPPPPIAETAAYDWSSDGSSFTHRHLILSGLRGGQTMTVIQFHRFLARPTHRF